MYKRYTNSIILLIIIIKVSFRVAGEEIYGIYIFSIYFLIIYPIHVIKIF